MLDIPALSRLASLAPQHLKLPTYFCANPYLKNGRHRLPWIDLAWADHVIVFEQSTENTLSKWCKTVGLEDLPALYLSQPRLSKLWQGEKKPVNNILNVYFQAIQIDLPPFIHGQ